MLHLSKLLLKVAGAFAIFADHAKDRSAGAGWCTNILESSWSEGTLKVLLLDLQISQLLL